MHSIYICRVFLKGRMCVHSPYSVLEEDVPGCTDHPYGLPVGIHSPFSRVTCPNMLLDVSGVLHVVVYAQSTEIPDDSIQEEACILCTL